MLVRRDDIARVGGIERHGGAIEGWGEWAAAMVAHVGALALPSAPLLAAATTPGLWRRRLAALRPG